MLCNGVKQTFIGCAYLVKAKAGSKPLCTVFSSLSESAAKTTYVRGSKYSHYEHEVWNPEKTIGHCAGFTHN